jgi:PIN domain nuclease of toxin-antitoxin system
VILLDTNAVIWLDRDHARTRALTRNRQSLHISPATLLELQFLEEAGRIRLFSGDAGAIAIDDRWTLDDPPAASWFAAAIELSWTRDPFDRLLAAHARLRGWRLATADATLIAGLGPRYSFEL